jgi:hypothetical protein
MKNDEVEVEIEIEIEIELKMKLEDHLYRPRVHVP